MALAAIAAVGGTQITSHVQHHPVQDATAAYGAMKLSNECIIRPIRKAMIAAVESVIDTVLSPMESARETIFKENIKNIIQEYEQKCLKPQSSSAEICKTAEDAENVATEIEIEFAQIYKDHLAGIFAQKGGIYKDPFKEAKDAYIQMRRKSAGHVPYDEIVIFEHVNDYVCHIFDLLSTWFRLQQPQTMWQQDPITFVFETQEECDAVVKMNNQQHYHFTTDPVFLRDSINLPVKPGTISEKCKMLKLVWWRFMDKYDDLETDVDDNNVINTWILHKLGWKQSGCTHKTAANIKRAFAEATCEEMDAIAAAYNADKLLHFVNKKAKAWFQVRDLRNPIEGECAQKLTNLWGIYRQRMSDLVPWAEEAHKKLELQEAQNKLHKKHEHHMHVNHEAKPKKKKLFRRPKKTSKNFPVLKAIKNHREELKDDKDDKQTVISQKDEDDKDHKEELKNDKDDKHAVIPHEDNEDKPRRRQKREKEEEWELRKNAAYAFDGDMNMEPLYYADDPLYSEYGRNYIEMNAVDPLFSQIQMENILVVLGIAMIFMFVIGGAIGCGMSYSIKRRRKTRHSEHIVVCSNDESV